MLTYDELFWSVPLHDAVLPVVEAALDRECLLSSFCSLVLGPGQEAQPIHEDTQLIPRRLQELCGYSVYKGPFGHIDNHDPIELLGRERGKRMVWEATDVKKARQAAGM